MKEKKAPFVIESIQQFCKIMDLPKPEHPLINLFRFESIHRLPEEISKSVIMNFYSIWFKQEFNGKMKYGRQLYDFDEGMMTFITPGQVITSEVEGELKHKGWWLAIHPDFLWGSTLAGKIKTYGYFSYDVSEALHLSTKEEKLIEGIISNIEQEYQSPIDGFSQDAILSQLETLLIYAERFYQRQFQTRKKANHQLLTKLEQFLVGYIQSNQLATEGIPTVQHIAAVLNISPNYLSDLLRLHTGRSTQQHIQEMVIEKAKELLSTTTLSVSEIAYTLGFDYPQTFSKLFKAKTTLSPIMFRNSFN